MCHASWAHKRPHGFSHFHGFDPQAGFAWGGFMAPWGGDEGFGAGGGFGVRRPLRFLAHKLELDEKQVVQLARILDELKTAPPDKKPSLIARAESWVVKHGPLLGTAAEILHKAIGGPTSHPH